MEEEAVKTEQAAAPETPMMSNPRLKVQAQRYRHANVHVQSSAIAEAARILACLPEDERTREMEAFLYATGYPGGVEGMKAEVAKRKDEAPAD